MKAAARYLSCASLIAVLALTGAVSTHAAILDEDVVGGVKVRSRPVLRLKAPDLYIPAGELTTIDGRELWSRSSSSRRAMASTTKIMAAVVVLENAGLDDEVVVGKTDLKAGESAMGLRDGERLTVRDLLEGLLIQSGNDAALALAEHVGGSVPAFVKMMNDKAALLDLVDTHYMNPHGLDVPGHYTSAADLTSLARYAMRDPEFRRIVRRYRARVRTPGYTHVLVNHNTMLKKYKGSEGIKTGWTDEAGYCVVTAARRGNVELVATVLGAASEAGRAEQATELLDWGFKHYRPVTVATAGERTGNVRVSDYIERTVPTEAAETTQVSVFDLAGPVKRRIALHPEVRAPVKRGQRLGTMTVFQGSRMLDQVPVVAAKDVAAPSFLASVGFFFVRLWNGLRGV